MAMSKEIVAVKKTHNMRPILMYCRSLEMKSDDDSAMKC